MPELHTSEHPFCFCFRAQFDVDEWLEQAVFAYNTSVHISTGLSPYELIFGRPAQMPIEV